MGATLLPYWGTNALYGGFFVVVWLVSLTDLSWIEDNLKSLSVFIFSEGRHGHGHEDGGLVEF